MVRIGFIGCHEISWFCLKKICQCCSKYNDEVVLAFDLEQAKASKYSASINFDSLAREYNFELFHVSSASDAQSIELLKKAKLDILFIIGWHRIVPQTVLDQAKIRLGIHSSLLPKDRGSSPINWQLIRGERNGGVTLFHLTDQVDSGNIVDSIEYEILDTDDVKDVYFKATLCSLTLLEKNWPQIHDLNINSLPQNDTEATINQRRKPEDGIIDWTKTAKNCYDWIRALTHPYPGAFTYWKGRKILIWESRIIEEKETKPGEVTSSGKRFIISTGKGSLELLTLQVENEPICNASIFSESYQLKKGDSFSSSNSKS